MTKFDAKSFAVSSDVYNTIASNQAAIDGDKAQSADALGRIKSAKLDNIVQLICGLAVVPLTQKGNLPTTVSASVKAELQEMAMQTKGMAENIVKYVAGTRREFDIGGDNITPDMVYDIFDRYQITLEDGSKKDAPIDSEKKLVDAIYGKGDAVSEVKKIVQKIAGKRSTKKDDKGNRVDGDKWIGGMEWEDIDALFGVGIGGELPAVGALADALRLRSEMEKAASEAAQAAGDTEADATAAINEMVEQFAEAS